MREYRLPVPVSILSALLDSYAKSGVTFSREMAAQDVMVDMESGRVKTYREYAQRWGWGASTVGDWMDRLKEIIKQQRDFGPKSQDNLPDSAGQDEKFAGQESANTHSNGRVAGQGGNAPGQTPDKHTPYIRAQHTHTYNKNKTLSNERVVHATKNRMKRPDETQVHDYMAEYAKKKGYRLCIEEKVEDFFDHYESNGWKVGRNPMKSWTHAAARWIRNAAKGTYSRKEGQNMTNYQKMEIKR